MSQSPRRPAARGLDSPDPSSAGRASATAGSSSEAVRAAVTGAILLCLVGIVLGIAGNSDSGSSALVRTVKGRLFSPWLTPPWLDLGFDYRLTYGSPEDSDHALEVRRHGDDRGAGVNLPGILTGERAARWRRLARSIGADVDDADRDGLLAAAVGRGTFDELGSQDVLVRVTRTPPTDRGGPPPAAATAYAARVRMAAGELQLLRQEARGEVAPLVRPEAAGTGRPSSEVP